MLIEEKVIGYRVNTYHGEGRSLHYLCEVSDYDSWEIVKTFRTREAAEREAKERNRKLRLKEAEAEDQERERLMWEESEEPSY
jgi:hypothetical protein